MKRREFIKLTSAAVALSAIPAVLVTKAAFDPSRIEWLGQYDSWNHYYGVALQYITPSGRKYRHAVQFENIEETREQDINGAKCVLLNWLEEYHGTFT